MKIEPCSAIQPTKLLVSSIKSTLLLIRNPNRRVSIISHERANLESYYLKKPTKQRRPKIKNHENNTKMISLWKIYQKRWNFYLLIQIFKQNGREKKPLVAVENKVFFSFFDYLIWERQWKKHKWQRCMWF